MQRYKEIISKKEYDQLYQLSRAELIQTVENKIPDNWSCGYGWYGCQLLQDNNKYYIIHDLGQSCD